MAAASHRLNFRVATTEDLEAVRALLTEAAEWARARGVEDWWPVPFPVEWVRPQIERGEIVVVETT
ncbi:MAG TPA: hypothetical protein VGV89_08515 [Thermoplasmata archaeon]|nr:hypothetical protein [Thermoplasmata archaeon]